MKDPFPLSLHCCIVTLFKSPLKHVTIHYLPFLQSDRAMAPLRPRAGDTSLHGQKRKTLTITYKGPFVRYSPTM